MVKTGRCSTCGKLICVCKPSPSAARPERMPIDFAFEVITRQDKPPFDVFEIEDKPTWMTVGRRGRSTSPEAFALPKELRFLDGRADPKLLADISKTAMSPYSLGIAPPERPQGDTHLPMGIPAVCALAATVEGLVVDRSARRIAPPEDFETTCAPGIANHVSYDVTPGARLVARSFG